MNEKKIAAFLKHAGEEQVKDIKTDMDFTLAGNKITIECEGRFFLVTITDIS